jgi:hypothetical protein
MIMKLVAVIATEFCHLQLNQAEINPNQKAKLLQELLDALDVMR